MKKIIFMLGLLAFSSCGTQNVADRDDYDDNRRDGYHDDRRDYDHDRDDRDNNRRWWWS